MDKDFADEYLLDRNIPHRLTSAPSQVVTYAIARMAADPTAKTWLDGRQQPVVFVGLDDNAFTWRVAVPPPAGSAVIIFGRGVLSKPSLQAAAVIGHELGHVWLRDHGQATGGQQEELAADAKAAEWGFKHDLAASLAADVAGETDQDRKKQLQARVEALGGWHAGATTPVTLAFVPLPAMYHFTHVTPAAQAVSHGLTPRVTPNDPLQVAGVWLSPNVYGFGTMGSFFGPIGLSIAPAHLAATTCVYLGPNPHYPSRHRFLLLPNGVSMPGGVPSQNTPVGLPSTTTPCELLLVGDVPATEVDAVVFGDAQGITEEESQLEHARFFGHLLAEQHRLIRTIPFPHSTKDIAYGGWWTFRALRDLLMEEARGGASATTPAMRKILSFMVTRGLGGRDGLRGLSAKSVRQWVTDEYARVFQTPGTALDLTADRA